MSLFGVIICAISVGVFKIAALGVDPFQSFMAGLDKLIPLDFGLLYIIVNALLLIFTDIVCVILGAALFVLGGGKISAIPTIAGIGTIITAFFMGPLIEFFNVHVARPILAKE